MQCTVLFAAYHGLFTFGKDNLQMLKTFVLGHLFFLENFPRVSPFQVAATLASEISPT